MIGKACFDEKARKDNAIKTFIFMASLPYRLVKDHTYQDMCMYIRSTPYMYI